MRTPTQAEILAGGRHVATFVGGGITMFAALHLITGGDAESAGKALSQIGNGFAEIVTGVGTMIAVISGLYATLSANPLWQLLSGSKAVAANPELAKSVAVQDQATVADAAQAMPQVQTVVASPAVAQATENQSVVATTDVEVVNKT